MSKRDLKLLLEDVLECSQKIKKYTHGYTFDDFLDDDKTIDAVVRNFEIIGEATSKINDDFNIKNGQIRWKEMKGLRNRMIHDYARLDLELFRKS